MKQFEFTSQLIPICILCNDQEILIELDTGEYRNGQKICSKFLTARSNGLCVFKNIINPNRSERAGIFKKDEIRMDSFCTNSGLY